MEQVAKGKERSTNFLLFILATSFICGALVMVIEVLGSRVIGPFFGSSLFVWTSLITVTLVALSAGYAAGGVIADRRESADFLYAIIMAAGFAVILVPFIKIMVLKACVPLGLRLGTLVCAAILFGPALFLLGCVSPYIVKIAASEIRNIGRTVGLFAAVSTVGSFVGTVCTGFLLISYFRVNQIFLAVGISLLILGLSYFILFRKRWQFTMLLLIPLALPYPAAPSFKLLDNGTTVTRVASKENFYGTMAVLDYSGADRRTREMNIDGLTQSAIDMNSGMSICEYTYYLQYLPYLLNPAGKDCLVIGLGAGIIPVWYESMGIRADVVDINPDVVALARNYFGFKVSGTVTVEDARYYLATTSKLYDYLILDVFNGDTTPSHILSREALQQLKVRLTGNGILAVNLIGSIKKETYMTASVVKTLRDVFRTVDIYPSRGSVGPDGVGNLTIIAYDQAPRTIPPDQLRLFPVHPLAAAVHSFDGRKFEFPADTPAIVLTDDYNPIDFFDVWLKEKLRADILKYSEWDMLI